MTFVSLRLVISSCAHFPEKNTAALSFLAGKQFSYAFFIPSSDRHLCWLHPLATINSVAGTTHVQAFLCSVDLEALGAQPVHMAGPFLAFGETLWSLYVCVCALHNMNVWIRGHPWMSAFAFQANVKEHFLLFTDLWVSKGSFVSASHLTTDALGLQIPITTAGFL